tara:strand:- start:12 stop:158 length:147 start_codon:yes stop_codon:yes gene_type:complete
MKRLFLLMALLIAFNINAFAQAIEVGDEVAETRHGLDENSIREVKAGV